MRFAPRPAAAGTAPLPRLLQCCPCVQATVFESLSLPQRAVSVRCASFPPPHSLFRMRERSDATGKASLARATSESAAAGAAEDRGNGRMVELAQLAALLGIWYLFNIYFNIYNKQVLKVFPYPETLTVFQLAVGTLMILFMWATNLYRRPKVSAAQLAALFPLAIVHTLGNLFTNMSLGKVSVSFTHTVKASEPFFSVVLAALFLGEFPSVWVLISLLPIVGGVSVASFTEASFNWSGFWSAMASNLTNQSRNVLSKKLVMVEESLDNINVFSIITIMSLFTSVPLMLLLMGGTKFTASSHELLAASLNRKEVFVRSLVAALCFHTYQQVSYTLLERVTPITHSVANCVKRVAVIVSSVLFFGTPVSAANAIGTSAALAGVFLYSRVKKLKAKASQ